MSQFSIRWLCGFWTFWCFNSLLGMAQSIQHNMKLTHKDTQLENFFGTTDFFNSCFEIPETLCLNRGTEVYTRPSNDPALCAYWSFDQQFSVDETESQMDLHPGFRAGPSVFGGASAYIHSKSQVAAHNRENSKARRDTPSNSFGLSLWIYVLSNISAQRGTNSIRSILAKGESLRVGVEENTGRLRVHSGLNSWVSKGIIPPRKWTHIFINCASGRTDIWINGFLSGELDSSRQGMYGESFIIGKLSKDSVSLEAYIDEVKLFNHAIMASEINALLGPPVILGGLDRENVILGCHDCSLEEAIKPATCAGPWSLCSREDWLRFGVRHARSLGYISTKSRAWTAEKALRSISGPGLQENRSSLAEGAEDVAEIELGVALCCRR